MQISGVATTCSTSYTISFFIFILRSYFNIFYNFTISYCVRYIIHNNKNDFAFAKLKMTSYYKRSHKLADIIIVSSTWELFCLCFFLLIWIPHLNCGAWQFSCKLCRPKQRKTIKTMFNSKVGAAVGTAEAIILLLAMYSLFAY